MQQGFQQADHAVVRELQSGDTSLVLAPIYLRLLFTAEPLDEATADQAARVALVAARAGALGSG